MKIGIISDIHAHLKPLESAISLFEAQGVSQIICAGDLVDGGWDDEAVIDFIRSHNIVSVQGNHDREAFMDQALLEVELWDADESTDDYFGGVLNDYRAEYVRSLPQTRAFVWEDLNIYLAHGAPWSDTDHVFPNVSAETCRRIFDTTGADIVVLGHTHIPMRVQFHDKWILNPGALCGNRQDLKRTCGILKLPQAEFDLFDADTNQQVELETVIILEGDL